MFELWNFLVANLGSGRFSGHVYGGFGIGRGGRIDFKKKIQFCIVVLSTYSTFTVFSRPISSSTPKIHVSHVPCPISHFSIIFVHAFILCLPIPFRRRGGKGRRTPPPPPHQTAYSKQQKSPLICEAKSRITPSCQKIKTPFVRTSGNRKKKKNNPSPLHFHPLPPPRDRVRNPFPSPPFTSPHTQTCTQKKKSKRTSPPPPSITFSQKREGEEVQRKEGKGKGKGNSSHFNRKAKNHHHPPPPAPQNRKIGSKKT